MDFFGKNPFATGFSLAGPSLGQVSQEQLQAQLEKCKELRLYYNVMYESSVGAGEAASAEWYLEQVNMTEKSCRRINRQIAQGYGAEGYEYQKQAPSSTEPMPERSSFMPSQDRTTAYYQSVPVPTSYYSQPSRSSISPRGGYSSVALSGGPSLGQLVDTLEGLKAQHARCLATLKYYITQIEYWNGQGNAEKANENQGYYDRTARECRGLQERIRQLEAQRLAPGSTVQARGSFVQPRGSMTAFRGPTPIPTSYYSQPSRSSYPTYGGYGPVAYSSPASRSSLSPFAPTLRGSGFWQELTTTPLAL